MSDLTNLNTQQVGKCGELLVQYKLLEFGVESAQPTTDYGVDLLAFIPTSAPNNKQVVRTIQVKASTHLGKFDSKWLSWSMPSKCKAEYVDVVDIERNKAWFFSKEEFECKAIGTKEGRWLWWYVPNHKPKRTTIKHSEEKFADYEFDTAVHRVFPER